jgi:HSP20 family protein
MEKYRSIKLKHLQGELDDLVYQLTKVQFTEFRSGETWQPAVNAYRCCSCFKICVDLAGVDRSMIDLRVEHSRLIIRGQRDLPEPEPGEEECRQVIMMEIDHGPFEREIMLPQNVDAQRISARQRDGLLWIELPLKE